METTKKRYPSDVCDEEWAFVARYLILITPDPKQRKYELREVYNASRWIVRAGAPWRYLPDTFPPWPAVHQQTLRWIEAGVFEDMVDDLRALLRKADGRNADPSAVILDSQTVDMRSKSTARHYRKRRKSRL